MATQVDYVAVSVRFALAVTLIVAGSAKLRHLADFEQAVAGFRLLPAGLVRPLALVVPAVEILLGLARVSDHESGRCGRPRPRLRCDDS